MAIEADRKDRRNESAAHLHLKKRWLQKSGGGAWGQQDPFNIVTNRFDHVSINCSGGTVGGTAGAQLQIGIETDLDWAGIRGSSNIDPTTFGFPAPFTVNASTSINWDLTARARVGYACDNWLFYATGGLALLGAKTDLKGIFGLNPCVTISVINGTTGRLTCDGTNKRLGGTIGAGIEYGFTPSLSAKIEYRYIAAASFELSHINEVLVGVNYRFGMADLPDASPGQEAAVGQDTALESNQENNGTDLTRPQTAFEVRGLDQTSSNDTSKTNKAQLLVRLTSRIPLDAGWRRACWLSSLSKSRRAPGYCFEARPCCSQELYASPLESLNCGSDPAFLLLHRDICQEA